jgi:hypothetical protein
MAVAVRSEIKIRNGKQHSVESPPPCSLARLSSSAGRIQSEPWPPPETRSRRRSSSRRWWATSGATPDPTPSAHGSGTAPPPSISSAAPSLPPFRSSPPRISIDRLTRRPPLARGMRKMERALPPPTLREKLPRFLQKCAQGFQDDPRYRDDPRYLRVWIQLVTTNPSRLLLRSAARPSRPSSPLHLPPLLLMRSVALLVLGGGAPFCERTATDCCGFHPDLAWLHLGLCGFWIRLQNLHQLAGLKASSIPCAAVVSVHTFACSYCKFHHTFRHECFP